MTTNVSTQSLIGKNGIPTVYIDKAVMAPASRRSGKKDKYGKTLSANGMLVTLDLVLVDVKINNRFQWSQNERLLKYVRLKVVESINPRLTKELSDKGFTERNLSQLKKRYGVNIRQKIMSVTKVDDIEAVENFEANGTATVYKVPYKVEFFIPNLNPSHLAYFCSCSLDTQAMRSDLDINIKNKRFDEIQGFVTGELLIVNSTVQAETALFKLPDDNIWAGPVHIHNKAGRRTIMAGPRHVRKKHPELSRILVPNFKIQDYRVLSRLQNLTYKLGSSSKSIDNIFIPPSTETGRSLVSESGYGPPSFSEPTKPSERYSKKENFVSDAFISRDEDGKSNLVFSIDHKRLLEKNAKFGELLTIDNPDIFEYVRSNSRIVSLKVLRTQMSDKGQPIRSKEELIVQNAENRAGSFKKKVYRRDRDGDQERKVRIGFIKEISLQGTKDMRSFSCTDFSMADVTDGSFKYSVEVEIMDGTIKYVHDFFKKIKQQKKALQAYYNESSLPRNYDSYLNKFKQRFIDSNSAKYPNLADSDINGGPTLNRRSRRNLKRSLATAPWNRSISILLEVLATMTNLPSNQIPSIASSLHAMVNPMTGTPEGIELLLSIYNHTENNLRRLMGVGTGSSGNVTLGISEVDNNLRSSVHKERFKKGSIKVRKDFSSSFEASVLNGVSYDFLGGNKRNKGGMRELTLNYILERMKREKLKYFTDGVSSGTDPLEDLNYTEFSYVTPAAVNYDIGKLKILGSGKSLWQRDKYSRASLALAAINSNPARSGPNTPLGSKLLYNGPSDIDLSLASSILSRSGVTIQPTTPLADTDTEKESETSADIVGDDTLSKLSQQVESNNSKSDFREKDQREERRRKREGRIMSRINNALVQRMMSGLSEDSISKARDRDVSPGLAGFDTRRSNNIIDKLYKKMSDSDFKIRNLPNQIKSLFLSDKNSTVNNWFEAESDLLLDPDLTEMFRYNYFIIQRIEYFDGYQTTRRDGKQISRPVFKTLRPSSIRSIPATGILCRMVMYKNPLVYADLPEHLRAPVQDEYFLIKIGNDDYSKSSRLVSVSDDEALPATDPLAGVGIRDFYGPEQDVILPPSVTTPETEVDMAPTTTGTIESLIIETPTIRAERRLAEAASLDRTAMRIMRLLLSKDRRLMSSSDRISRAMRYMQFGTTLVITQPVDLILLGAQIGTMEDPVRRRERSTRLPNRIVGTPVPLVPEGRELDGVIATSDLLTLGGAPASTTSAAPSVGTDVSVPSSPPATSALETDSSELAGALGYTPPNIGAGGSGGGY